MCSKGQQQRPRAIYISHINHVILLVLAVFAWLGSANLQPAKCDVFDPFKVLPDNNKYQIGGAFPLHQPDCLKLIPSTVQEIVTVQWALSHWNQKQSNGSTSKLGFFAGDSCSRPKEAISQTLRFLDSVGYHEPLECQQKAIPLKTTHLAGILSPKDQASASALAGVLKPTNVPIIAYTTASLQEYIDQGVSNVISTAPTLDSYIQTLVRLLQLLKSNLVAIVEEGEGGSSIWPHKLSAQLKQEGVNVAEIIGYDHAMLNKVLLASDAQVILSLVANRRMKQELKLDENLLKSKKIWITLELGNEEDEGGLDENTIDFLETAAEERNSNPDEIKLQLITIRAKHTPLAEFNAYFLRVLTNNYESFSLLTSYVQQVFNCSIESRKSVENNVVSSAFEQCNLESKQLLKKHKASKNVLPLFKAVYSLALAVKNIEGDAALKELCENPSLSIQCYESIAKEMLHLDYDFSKDVPSELKSHSIRYHLHTTQDGNQVILLTDMAIEAVLVEREGRDGSMLYKLLEMKTDVVPKFILHSVPTKLKSIQSICQPYKPICGRCNDNKGNWLSREWMMIQSSCPILSNTLSTWLAYSTSTKDPTVKSC